MARKAPFQLVGHLKSEETIGLLADLLKRSHSGEILGLAVVSIHANRQYQMHITGEAARSPTFALGTVTKLQADIAALVNEEAK